MFQWQKVTIIAMTAVDSIARRRLFALINSFIAVFILAGQLTLTVDICFEYFLLADIIFFWT